MNFDRRRAVSPIIATLLLIAIAVAAGVLVYVYVNSLSGGLTGSNGNQVAQQMQLQAYSFTSVGGTGVSSTNWVVDVFIENVGGSAVTISNIYYDGTALNEWYNTGGSYDRYLQVDTSGGNCFAAIPGGVLITGNNAASQTTSGNGASCSTAGAAQNCSTHICIDTGATAANQVETLTLASQSSNQLIFALNAQATAGTSHTIKIVTSSGGVAVFSVVAGRTG